MGLLHALLNIIASRPVAVPDSWHRCCNCRGQRTELIPPANSADLAAGPRHTPCSSCNGIGWHAWHR